LMVAAATDSSKVKPIPKQAKVSAKGIDGENPPPGLRFLDAQTLAAMFTLSKDIEPVPVEINRLDNQVLVRYYEGEWKRFE